MTATVSGPRLVMNVVRTMALNDLLTRPVAAKLINVGNAMIDPNHGMKMRHGYP